MSEIKPSNLVGKDVNPESLQRPKRRIFRSEQKMAILDEIDTSPHQVGLILRREGIYSSHLFQWRRWREKMGKGSTKDVHNNLAKATRKIASLELKLKKAELIIDIQKKISEMMQLDQNQENQCDVP
jgi:transposase